jgi:hypothetical protein
MLVLLLLLLVVVVVVVVAFSSHLGLPGGSRHERNPSSNKVLMTDDDLGAGPSSHGGKQLCCEFAEGGCLK